MQSATTVRGRFQKFRPEDDVIVLRRSIDLSFGIAVVILNIIEITIICRLKRKKKIHEILLLSLSVADFLFGLSNSIVCIIFLSDYRKREGLEITYTTYFYFIATSILHLTWITLDRLWAVHAPMKHNINVTKKRTIKLIIVTWIFTTIVTSSFFIYDRRTESRGNKTVNNNVTNATAKFKRRSKGKESEYKTIIQQACSIIILIADIVFIISYSFIIYLLNKRSNVAKSISAAARENQIKTTILCTFVASVFVLFTFPYATVSLINGSANLWSNVLLVSNSAMNSIVYCFRGKFSNYLKKRRQEKQKRSQGMSNKTALSTPVTTPQGTPTLTNRLTQVKEPIARCKQSTHL